MNIEISWLKTKYLLNDNMKNIQISYISPFKMTRNWYILQILEGGKLIFFYFCRTQMLHSIFLRSLKRRFFEIFWGLLWLFEMGKDEKTWNFFQDFIGTSGVGISGVEVNKTFCFHDTKRWLCFIFWKING